MNITKKIDRAFQRVGEKMGGGAQTSMSDDFKMLEIETNLRHDGMERLQKSTNVYVKSISRRCDGSEDKEKGLPVSLLGRTFVSHGEDFGPDSEFGNCLIALGRANDRMGSFQESFATDAATLWLDSIERNLAMMKDYQTARKKLENRRLTYDSTMSKMQKARRDDIRIEEELRTNKAKYEESSEDVMQRMQDIQETEAESLQDLTGFLEAELEYHERCAEELRKVRQNWAMSMDGYTKPQYNGYATPERKLTTRSRSNTARSWTNPLSRTSSNTNVYNDPEPEPVRIAIRSSSRQSNYAPEIPTRPAMGRANTYAPGAPADRARANSGASTPVYSQNVTALRAGLRPVSTNMPSGAAAAGTPRNHHGGGGGDVFADDGGEDTASGSGSPEWGERSASPATSYGSLSRSSTNNLLPPSGGGGGGGGVRKPPPPPPPSRAKKPAPPVPARRDLGY